MVCEIDTGSNRGQTGGPIKGSGVETREPKTRRHLFAHRALPGARRAVEGNDEVGHGPGAYPSGGEGPDP